VQLGGIDSVLSWGLGQSEHVAILEERRSGAIPGWEYSVGLHGVKRTSCSHYVSERPNKQHDSTESIITAWKMWWETTTTMNILTSWRYIHPYQRKFLFLKICGKVRGECWVNNENEFLCSTFLVNKICSVQGHNQQHFAYNVMNTCGYKWEHHTSVSSLVRPIFRLVFWDRSTRQLYQCSIMHEYVVLLGVVNCKNKSNK